MHQTKKGSFWHFGMKMHIDVDDKLGLIHSIETTAATVHDIVPADKLLHGEEQRVFDDAGQLGIQKRDEHKHKHRNDISWYIAKRPSTRKKLDARRQKVERIKASTRAKVEPPFGTSNTFLVMARLAIVGWPKTLSACTYWRRSTIG